MPLCTQSSHLLRILTSDFHWVILTLRPVSDAIENAHVLFVIGGPDLAPLSPIRTARITQSTAGLTLVLLLEDSSVLLVKEAGLCCADTLLEDARFTMIVPTTGTARNLSFHHMDQCVVHALKGLARCAHDTQASSPASHCIQCSALMPPSLHARSCPSPSRAR